MHQFTKHAIIVYWLLVVTELVAILLQLQVIHEALKPLLMPALALPILLKITPSKTFLLILGGLACSWLGDVFLLFESYGSIFFILGLASFLLAHICYICFFAGINPGIRGLLTKRPIFLFLVGAYCVGLYLLLLPSLGTLKIPVLIYAVVIGCMLLCSMNVYPKLLKPANVNFIAGALLFVVSDSVLAFNKFYQPFSGAGFIIMLTYCAAQFYIVKGFLAYVESVLANQTILASPSILP